MCGFAGYISLIASGEIDAQLLDNMQKKLIHRGPDGAGKWISQEYKIGFTHRRLILLDTSSAGTQPMSMPDGSVTLIFNGEIYNHLHLRKTLETLGYSYQSTSDTETLLYAFHAWGIECFNKLEGEFAFAIFDKRTNELYCVRDRIGIKPLYFSEKNGWFSFASEIKALKCLPWIEETINHQALYHYLTFMVTPAPLTIYADVYKLPAGYYAKVSANRVVTFHEWYNPLHSFSIQESERAQSESYCIEKIQTLLRNAVHSRMSADVPVGVLLSGGVDSSAITALMANYSSASISTFSISFKDGAEYNEQAWAKKIANRYGTTHFTLEISEKEAVNFFDNMTYYHDEPLADCVSIPLYYVARLAYEKGVRAVLVGEGADELFFGYDSYVKILNRSVTFEQTKRIPSIFRSLFFEGFKKIFPNHFHYADLLFDWSKNRPLYWGGAIVLKEYTKSHLYKKRPLAQYDTMVERIYPGFDQSLDSYSWVEYHLKKLHEYIPQADSSLKLLYLELKHRLPELLLMRADKMTMANSLESRVPFLDHSLVEYALHIPYNLKYRHNTTKYILKKALHSLLPHDTLYRKKIGFAAPTTRWFRSGRFEEKMKALLYKKGFFKETNFNASFIEKLYNDHFSNRRDEATCLWLLQNIDPYLPHEKN